ncbi:MAG TPA: hypothetical protein VKV20_16025 [Ktedonobacteraceae bacterium]|jgi:hypothetical protein|nr:hypothetical protein [Ktedonobacteraceae bacterium]
MLHRRQIESSNKRFQDTILRVLHSPILYINLFLILGVSLLSQATHGTVQAHAPTPADQFMQSVVERDGALGWRQLCPTLQAQLPLSTLTGQVEQERRAEAGEHLTFTLDYIGARAQPQGGQIRLYIITAHRPNGWVAQRTYIVYTQASGCVEDVKSF